MYVAYFGLDITLLHFCFDYIVLSKAVFIVGKGTLTRLKEFSSPSRLLEVPGWHVAEEFLPKRSRCASSITLPPVVLVRICVVANPPNHETRVAIHQPSRFHLDTEVSPPGMLSDPVPLSSILDKCVPRRDDAVVESRAPRWTFSLGSQSRQSPPPECS